MTTRFYFVAHEAWRWRPLALTVISVALFVVNCEHPLDRKHGNWE